jgi:hypothetical protein
MSHAKEPAMETVPTVTLPARQLFEITDAAGVRILCTAGCLWLTLDHDPRDVILQPGDSFEGEAPRRALLYAFEPSTFALSASARAGPQPRGKLAGPALAGRLGGQPGLRSTRAPRRRTSRRYRVRVAAVQEAQSQVHLRCPDREDPRVPAGGEFSELDRVRCGKARLTVWLPGFTSARR